MKKIRLIPALMIFVLTIGSAFFTKAKNNLMVQEYGEFKRGCVLGTLNENNCGQAVTSFGRCTVTGGIETVVAWDNRFFGFCVDALYKQAP